LILIQRSEGGALGIGGGGGGGLMSGRSATTSIARMTGILGAVFIANCLALSVVYQIENRDNLIIDDAAVASQPAERPAETPPAQPDERR
jgi:preprotein translocase subunit SecG